jgi:hypothetical protein
MAYVIHWLLRVLLLTVYVTAPSYCSSLAPFSISYTTAEENNLKELLQQTTQTSARLTHELIRALDTIEFSIHFWQLQLESSLFSVVAHSPTLLLKPNYREIIAEHLTQLRLEQEHIACCLGKLYQLKKTAQVPLERSYEAGYISKSIVVLKECLKSVRYYPAEFTGTITIEDAQIILVELNTYIDTYQTALSHKLKEHWAPPHLVRNWLKYTAISGATLALCAYIYAHRTPIKAFCTEAQCRLSHFWKEHIMLPLKNTYEELFVKTYVPIGDPEVYQSKKEFAQDRYRALITKLRPTINENPELLATEVENSLSGKGRIINEEWNTQAQKPLYNAFAGSFIQLLEARYVVPYDLQAAKVAIAVDDIYKTLRSVIQLLGITPALLGSAGILWAGKSVVQNLHHSSDYSDIQHTLRNLHNLCIVCSNSCEAETDRYHGFFYYWLHKSFEALPSLPTQHRIPFKEDLTLLADQTLSCEQHLMVLNRMYTTHTFLKN